MITTTIEFVCDSCKAVISSVGPYDKPTDLVMTVAESVARQHGAQINVASVTCSECLKSALEMTSDPFKSEPLEADQ